MESLILVVIILGLLFTLGKSAKMVEGTFVLIAKKLKINDFIVGFVILSIITSLPEISIAVASSQNIPELSVGNEVGSTAILLTLIVGINAFRFRKITFKGNFSEKEILIGIVSVLLMLLAIVDKYISVIEGASLILIYVLYILYLNRKFAKKVNLRTTMVSAMKLYNTLGIAAVGIVLLILSSTLIVKAANSLAFNLEISPAMIGIFLLAIGTNIPELTISLTSKTNKEEEALSVGNVLGSLFLNPGTVGLLAILSNGVKIVDLTALAPSLVVCFIALLLFGIFTYTGKVLTRAEGMILMGVYASLVITEIIILFGNF